MSLHKKINPRQKGGSSSTRGGSTSAGTSVRGGSVTPPVIPSTIPFSGFVGGKTDLPRTPIDNLHANAIDPDWNSTKFAELLSQLQGGQTDASQLLASLLNAGNGKFPEERWDMLYQYLLQLASTADQRNFDWNMLQESRQYNNPTNALARLMGAGVSRDAAIQLLGSSGGSGAAGSAIGSGAGVSAPGVSGISGTQAVNQGNMYISAANTAINGFCALADCGMNLAASAEQVHYLKNQNFFTDQQKTAYQMASQAYSIINAAGVEKTPEAVGSVDAVSKTMQNLANSGNEAAIAFIQNGGVKKLRHSSPYASPYLANLYQSERSSGDYAQNFIATQRKLNASSALDEVSYDKVREEICNLGAEFGQIVASTDFIDRQNAFLDKQADYLEKQGKLAEAQALRESKVSEQVQLHNNIAAAVQTAEFDGRTGLEWLTDKTLTDLYMDCQVLAKTNNPEHIQQLADAIMSDPKKVAAVNAFMIYRQNQSLDYAKKNPEFARFCMAIEDCGLGKFFELSIQNKSYNWWNKMAFPDNFGITSSPESVFNSSSSGSKSSGRRF